MPEKCLEKIELTEGESHNSTSTEGSVEAVLPARLLGTDSGPDIGVHSDLHSKVTRN